MTEYKHSSYGTDEPKIILYPETSNEENMVTDILDHMENMYHETYDSCWSWDGNTECWDGFALYWNDVFVDQYTDWDDAGDFHNDLDDENITDTTEVHMGLINDAWNSSGCGGSWGRSPYCSDTKRPSPYVDMDCQSDAGDAAQTACMESNHCLIDSDNTDVKDLTGSNDNQHSLGQFVSTIDGDKCTPMICGYGNLEDTGNCQSDGSGTKDPTLSFTNCTHYSIAVSEDHC